MFFLKDPFTDDVTGPISEHKLREVALAGKISGAWEISKSKTGPWQSVASVRGLQLGSSTTATTNTPPPTQAEQPTSRLVDSANAAMKTVQSQFDAARRAHFSSSTSVLDIFDWQFKKYLTPWILRITWAIVLVVAPFLLLLFLIQIVGIWLPEFQWSDTDGSGAVDRMRRMETSVPAEPFLPFWFRIRVAGTIIQFARIAGIAVSILWIRVLLELAIVLFNIATTLSSIDLGIKEQSKKD